MVTAGISTRRPREPPRIHQKVRWPNTSRQSARLLRQHLREARQSRVRIKLAGPVLDLKDRTKTSNRPNYPCTADAKEEAASSKDLRLLRCKRLGLLHQSSHLSHALWKSVRCCTRTTKRGQNFRPHQHRPCLRALRHVQRSVHPAHHHRRANRCTHLLKMQISSRTWPSLSVIRSRR